MTRADLPATGSPAQPAEYAQPTLFDHLPDPPATSNLPVAAQGYPRDTSARLARLYASSTADRPTATNQPRLLAAGTGASRSTWRQLFRVAADRAAVAAVTLVGHPNLSTRNPDDRAWAQAAAAAATTLGDRIPWAAIRVAHQPNRIVLLLATGAKPPATRLRAAAHAAANVLTAPPTRRPTAGFPHAPRQAAGPTASPTAPEPPASQPGQTSRPLRR